MRVTLFGTRGSLAAPGAETNRYGGNTSTVEVGANDGSLLILDAGTGIRRLAKQIPPRRNRSIFFLRISTWITGLVGHSMIRVLMSTFGGLPAVCSDLRRAFPATYLRPCFRCTFVTCRRSSVTRCRVPHST
jgi:hypothetical protein